MDKDEAARILYDAMESEDERRRRLPMTDPVRQHPFPTVAERKLAQERAAFEAGVKAQVTREQAQNALNKAFRTERENAEDYLADALRIMVQDARNAERTSW